MSHIAALMKIYVYRYSAFKMDCVVHNYVVVGTEARDQCHRLWHRNTINALSVEIYSNMSKAWVKNSNQFSWLDKQKKWNWVLQATLVGKQKTKFNGD